MTPHHRLPQLAERQVHSCDACKLPIVWGHAFVVRGVRRKLRWHIACDPAPRCPRCGVRCDDPWGCILCRTFASELTGLAWALSSIQIPPPNEERVAHLFRVIGVMAWQGEPAVD